MLLPLYLFIICSCSTFFSSLFFIHLDSVPVYCFCSSYLCILWVISIGVRSFIWDYYDQQRETFIQFTLKGSEKAKTFEQKWFFCCWFSIHCIWTAMVEKTRITKLWISVLQCIPKVNEVEVKLPCLCSIWISWKSFDVMQKSRDEDFGWRSGKTWKYGVCKCLCACMC